MNKLTKIFALLMALVLCLSFAACGGNDEPETTTAPDAEATTVAGESDDVNATVADDTTAVEDDTTASEETTAAGETTTAAEGEATTVEGETTTAAAASKPEGTAEVVAYFNTAVNKVKTSAKSVQQKNVTNYLASSATVPSVLSFVYKTLGGDEWLDGVLKDNSQGAVTFSTREEIKHGFPVEDQTWASKLTAADVKSATCTESNGIYTITILTKPDGKSSTYDYGQGHNPKALNAVPPRVINDNIPGIATSITGTASMNYPYGKIVITVDAATGNVKTADYDIQWTINFDDAGAIIPLGTRSSYVVTF